MVFKKFFIGQNLKHVHMTSFSWTFDLLLINSRYLVFGVYFSPHQRNAVCEYKLYVKPITEYQFISDIDVVETCFLM